MDLSLCYGGGDLKPIRYSDADWASDKDEHKSTSGYAFTDLQEADLHRLIHNGS